MKYKDINVWTGFIWFRQGPFIFWHEISWPAERLLAFQEGFCSLKKVNVTLISYICRSFTQGMDKGEIKEPTQSMFHHIFDDFNSKSACGTLNLALPCGKFYSSVLESSA
jgi:hypothetical protein